jgi:hypothetical protein
MLLIINRKEATLTLTLLHHSGYAKVKSYSEGAENTKTKIREKLGDPHAK